MAQDTQLDTKLWKLMVSNIDVGLIIDTKQIPLADGLSSTHDL